MERMEKQLTAVGWLESLYYPEYIPKHIIEQAKEMEKQNTKQFKTSKMKTAVEWLVNEINKLDMPINDSQHDIALDIIDKAKEMEKQNTKQFKTSKMKTAVEWLKKEYELSLFLTVEDFKKAKEMEKAQKAKEYIRGYNDAKQIDILLNELNK